MRTGMWPSTRRSRSRLRTEGGVQAGAAVHPELCRPLLSGFGLVASRTDSSIWPDAQISSDRIGRENGRRGEGHIVLNEKREGATGKVQVVAGCSENKP